MKPRPICILLLLIAAVPLHADDVKPVAVPFELLKSGHMAVTIKVNGKGPYRVIFDTGSPTTVLNNKIAKESGLLRDAPKPMFTIFGSMGQVTVKELEVGGLKAENTEAIVMDHPTVEAMASVFGPIDGIVGCPFFARYKVTIDYQAKQLTFVPTNFHPPNVMEAIMASLTNLTSEKEPATVVIAPSAQWGMVVIKDNDADAGVTIKAVFPGGPSAVAGIKAGDRLLTLDGHWTDTVVDCYTAAGQVKAGKPVKVLIKREGKEKELTVTPSSGL